MATILKLVVIALAVVAVLFVVPGWVPEFNKPAFSAAGVAFTWTALTAMVVGVFGLLYMKVSHK